MTAIGMMMLKWLMGNKLSAVLILALIGSLGYTAWNKWELHSAQTYVAKVKAALVVEQANSAVCEASVASLQDAIQQRNTITQGMKKNAEDKQKTVNEQSQSILSSPAPSVEGSGASQLNSFLKQLGEH